jgi:hypothetical protein
MSASRQGSEGGPSLKLAADRMFTTERRQASHRIATSWGVRHRDGRLHTDLGGLTPLWQLNDLLGLLN